MAVEACASCSVMNSGTCGPRPRLLQLLQRCAASSLSSERLAMRSACSQIREGRGGGGQAGHVLPRKGGGREDAREAHRLTHVPPPSCCSFERSRLEISASSRPAWCENWSHVISRVVEPPKSSKNRSIDDLERRWSSSSSSSRPMNSTACHIREEAGCEHEDEDVDDEDEEEEDDDDDDDDAELPRRAAACAPAG